MKRQCGILFPVFSVPSEFGIGCFSREAYEFVDFLKKSGQSYWQVLPLGPTGFGDSPYQPVSAFAGNQNYVDLRALIEDGLLREDDVRCLDFGQNQERVDYGALYTNRGRALRMAYPAFCERLLDSKKQTEEIKDAQDKTAAAYTVMTDGTAGAAAENVTDPAGPAAERASDAAASAVDMKSENAALSAADMKSDNTVLPEKSLYEKYTEFCERESYWLDDYCLYCALKEKFEGKSWLEWDDGYRERRADTLSRAKKELQDEISFFRFVQFEFFTQWERLHRYARKQGIEFIGDVPFYVSMDSADAWAHPEVFRFDRDLKPEYIAGCPPDAFSVTGQLWGNPVYDWERGRKDHYSWWIRRIRANMELFDILRIDHFHGFSNYYEIPYGDETAENGIMKKGPGMSFFREMKKALGEVPLIAEDLGTITPENEQLLKDSGYPGMKVLQYAFDGSESSWYLTYHHPFHCVVYTGTHDNTTILDWVEHASDHDRDFARQFIHSENTDYGAFVWDFIREAYRSPADTCIVPLQNYLVKGSEARINTPGSQGTNWQWRLAPNYLSDALAVSIHNLARIYGRLPKTEPKITGGQNDRK